MTVMPSVGTCVRNNRAPVMIIDHRPVMRLALKKILSETADQVQVIEYANAFSALSASDKNPDSVVFAAHAPPDHDGLALLARLRGDGQPTRLVLYGNSFGFDAVMTSLRADVDGLLPECAALVEYVECFNAVSQGGKWLSQAILNTAMKDPVAMADTSDNALSDLTRRQQEIAHMIAQGYSNKQIAHATGLAEGTIKMHIHRIFRRLNIPNRAALAAVVGDRLQAILDNQAVQDNDLDLGLISTDQ